MKISLSHNDTTYSVDLSCGVDLSLAFGLEGGPKAYHAPSVQMEPVRIGNWVGEVSQGGAVNYRNISFNPHGNGTHTECVGHIDEHIHSVNRSFKEFHCLAQLISIEPISIVGSGLVIMPDQIPELEGVPAVIIRTIPNDATKSSTNYSGSDPAYLNHQTVTKLVNMGCRHLILDLPSVDREEDAGKLLGHRAFWNYPQAPRMDCTITELAYIPDSLVDGLYLLNLQVAPFENDAAPSRPVVFSLNRQ